jgi:hypothetical protein
MKSHGPATAEAGNATGALPDVGKDIKIGAKSWQTKLQSLSLP